MSSEFFLEDFLLTTFKDNRNKKRTDVLHKVVLNEFLNLYPEYSEYVWKYEVDLPDSYGSKFRVDIVGFGKNGGAKIAICDKSMNGNISQNLKNYANCSVGESIRLLYAEENQDIEKMIFFTVMPRRAPYFTKNGEKKHIEDVVKARKNTNIDKVMNKLWGERVELIHYSYDIVEVDEYTKKEEFATGISIRNLVKE